MKIMPTIERVIGAPVKAIANNKYMKDFCDKFVKEPDKMLAYTTIASLVAKDGVGCYLYVKQSLNNEKIPEEKRSFVAALDLTNGLLMILSQLIAFFTFDSKVVQSKLFGKFFDKIFETKSVNKLITQIRNALKHDVKTIDKAKVAQEIDKFKKVSQDMFKFVTSLVASTIIAKRVVVPFLATPLAGWAQEKFIDKKMKKDTNPSIEADKTKLADNTKLEVSPSATKTSKELEFKGNLLRKYTDK